MDYINIFIKSVFVDNMIFAFFLGMCSYLAVSKTVKTSAGLGIAVTFVLLITVPVNYLINKYLLLPFGLEFLQTIAFILVIAALVQIVEIVLKKISPSLYQALGIFLPLITTNCAVLGVAITVVTKEFAYGGAEPHLLNLGEATVYALATSVGYGIAMILFAGLREHLAGNQVPQAFKGLPIALITVGIMAMAFLGFSGIV